jgi:hypothetical protein
MSIKEDIKKIPPPPIDVLMARADAEVLRKPPSAYYTPVITRLRVEKLFTGGKIHQWLVAHGVRHVGKATVFKIMAEATKVAAAGGGADATHQSA